MNEDKVSPTQKPIEEPGTSGTSGTSQISSSFFIQEMEKKYPEMTKEFKKIVKEQYELFCKKNLNYGTSNIAVGTPLQTYEDVKLSLTGLWFRQFDKINRIKQLIVLGNPDAVNETAEETYKDLSVYAIISQIVVRGKWGK